MKTTGRLSRILLGIHLGAGPLVGLLGSGLLLGSTFSGHSQSPWAFLLVALPGLALGVVPSNTTMLAAGAAFGWRGTPLVFAGLLLASLPGFLTIRHVFRSELRERLDAIPRTRRIARALERWEFPAAILLRIAPVSTFAWTNALLAVGTQPLLRYLAATAIGILPRLLLLTWAGDSASDLFQSLQAGQFDPPALIGLGLAVTALTGAALLAARILKAAQADGDSESDGDPKVLLRKTC